MIVLERVVQPQPTKPKTCGCGVFVAEVLVPDGDSCREMCWICAHGFVDHGREPGMLTSAECSCTAEQIYPEDVCERRRRIVTS